MSRLKEITRKKYRVNKMSEINAVIEKLYPDFTCDYIPTQAEFDFMLTDMKTFLPYLLWIRQNGVPKSKEEKDILRNINKVLMEIIDQNEEIEPEEDEARI